MIYGNPRYNGEGLWCCDENGRFLRDANDALIPADPQTGQPKSEQPALCPECQRPLPRKR
jgi:hypothetical protein